ncbi:MAG: DNA polymerase III subunit alpha, partial [Clostridiales bacterium]|nr:DNA polymerase III subunit alpha [Clostridiales bacterium]
TVNHHLMALSEQLGIPLVATNDCHYTYEEDAEAHDLLLCIQTGKKVSDEDRMRYEGGQYFVKSEDQMRALFPYAQQALDNTQMIADRCHVEIEIGGSKLPSYDVPEGYNSWTYLNKLCDDGFKERYPDDDGTLRDRLNFELNIIKNMGYVDYFLIVWDYINFCRENDIAVGPGRGSAAGSIVSYCIHITNIDPIKYDLFFERFLNPERVSMPDIDVDFEYERRQEVIDYVTRKYGPDRVMQIITFGSLLAKGVVRDVARVMDLPYSYGDQISKMIPGDPKITLNDALIKSPDLRKIYDEDETAHKLIDMCKKLEGLPRHTSIHAAGVVICNQPAENLIPLGRSAEGGTTTQFPWGTTEKLGLLKMDFLGLRTLTVIKDAVRFANNSIGAGPGDPNFIDIDLIDYNDPKVLSYIGTGQCDGIFQLESAGMKSFMKELKPQSLEDIIAGVALYRPGPMDFIPKYIEGKKNAGSIHYATPMLEPILKTTYGCIVYQEQVMQIFQQLAGFTLGRADMVRRAMSKKHRDELEREESNFIYGNPEQNIPGCVSKGISPEVAKEIFDSMMSFAAYAFNKAHAACYAVVSLQTAWLKYYYPAEFMAALMTSVIDNSGKVSEYIMSCRSMGITLLPPDINEGFEGFSVADTQDGKKAIRYALTAIKGVGGPIISGIVREREIRGRFKDLNDFLTRMEGSDCDVNKRAIENFIKAGAFDCFGHTRKQMITVYGQIMDQLHTSGKNAMAGQMTLFDIAGEDQKKQYEIPMPNVGEFERELLLEFEKDVLGIYASGHPLEEYINMWKKKITNVSTDFQVEMSKDSTDDDKHEPTTNDVPKVRDEARATVGGIITAKTIKYTKTQQVMAFVTLEDLVGSMEVIVFPKNYETYSQILNEDAKVFIEGRVSVEEGKSAKLIAGKVMTFEEVPKTVWIQFENKEAYEAGASRLDELIAESDGRDEVKIYLKETKQVKALGRSQSVCADKRTLSALCEAFGKENVQLT